jgi:hypothetical protein
MTGDARGAKRPFESPLDGGLRPRKLPWREAIFISHAISSIGESFRTCLELTELRRKTVASGKRLVARFLTISFKNTRLADESIQTIDDEGSLIAMFLTRFHPLITEAFKLPSRPCGTKVMIAPPASNSMVSVGSAASP